MSNTNRPHILIAPGLVLSVQASAFHYCEPREDGLELDEYNRVEVAILKDGEFVKPDQLGLPGDWSDVFVEHDDVAPYVSQPRVKDLRAALEKQFGQPKDK